MSHDGERKGLYGSINLISGEVGEHIRKMMERGMVAHKPRMDGAHISRLIRFTSYAGIEGGPLQLIKENGKDWWPGWMVASDSSPVELSMGDETDWYNSNRVLLSTIVALDLDAQGVKKADDHLQFQGTVDPSWSTCALRKSGVGWEGGGQIFLVLPGNGILYQHDGAPKPPQSESLGFRHAMEEMLRTAKTWKPDETLWGTYTRLLCSWKPKNSQDATKSIRYGHQEDVWVYFEKTPSGVVGLLQACPQCRVAIPGGAFIAEGKDIPSLSEDGTFYQCVNCKEQTRLIDACGISYPHSTEQSNLHIMNSFSVFLEHLLLYSWCRQFNSSQLSKKDHHQVYENGKTSPIFVMDGPLALFGSCGRFTRAFRLEVQNTVANGATIFGIVKTGKLRHFVESIPQSIKGGRASFFIIPDLVRYEMIEIGQKPSHYGFGGMSYYGQDVIVRTRRGLTFTLSVGTPPMREKWWHQQKVKDSLNEKQKVVEKILTTPMKPPSNFNKKSALEFATLDEWMDFNNQNPSPVKPTAPLWRVISTLEHIESLMFQQSSIPQIFAHMLAGTHISLMKSFLKSINTKSQTKDDASQPLNKSGVSNESTSINPSEGGPKVKF